MKRSRDEANATPRGESSLFETLNANAALEERIESHLLSLVESLGHEQTACPSEVPRELFPGEIWRQHLDLTKRIAARLACAGLLQVEQKKAVIDPRQWDADGRPGIVRLRLAQGRNFHDCGLQEPGSIYHVSQGGGEPSLMSQRASKEKPPKLLRVRNPNASAV